MEAGGSGGLGGYFVAKGYIEQVGDEVSPGTGGAGRGKDFGWVFRQNILEDAEDGLHRLSAGTCVPGCNDTVSFIQNHDFSGYRTDIDA